MRGSRWLRSPLVHFVIGGGVLFRLVYGPSPFTAAAHGGPPEPIVITAADVARLRADYTRDSGLTPSDEDEAALIDKAIDEELLFREALARGLDRNDRSVRTWLTEQMAVLADDGTTDPEQLYARARALGLDRTDLVVRRMLVQKMRLLAARVHETAPTDDTLRTFHARHRDDYTPPARVSLWHVFFSSATHGDRALAVAATHLAALQRDGRAPAEAVRDGDSFVVPAHLVAQSPAQLAKVFGPAFTDRIAVAGTGTWVGPVASPYGAHLVWIEAREPSTAPPFEAVAGQVRERWLDEQRRLRVDRLVRALAERTPVEVASPAWRARGRR